MITDEEEKGIFIFFNCLCDALITIKCDNEIEQEIKLDIDAYEKWVSFSDNLKTKHGYDYDNIIHYRGFKFKIVHFKQL